MGSCCSCCAKEPPPAAAEQEVVEEKPKKSQYDDGWAEEVAPDGEVSIEDSYFTLQPEFIIKIDVSKVPQEDVDVPFTTFKLKTEMGEPEAEEVKWRLSGSNVLLIMLSRWRWIQANPAIFVNLLRRAGYADEDIQLLCDRKKPLDFNTVDDYKECISDLYDVGHKIMRRTKLTDIEFIQQGSSCLGFSTNPCKGRRFTPTHVYGETSDTDFRFTAKGMEDFIKKCAAEGKDVAPRPGATHVLAPHQAPALFPEIAAFSKKWAPRVRAKAEHVQFTVVIEPEHAFFRAKLWDLPLHHSLKYHESTGHHAWDAKKDKAEVGRMERWGSASSMKERRSKSGTFKKTEPKMSDREKAAMEKAIKAKTPEKQAGKMEQWGSGGPSRSNSRTSNNRASRDQVRRQGSGKSDAAE